MEIFLGITIDNNRKEHIKNICKKAGNKLNALARIAKYLDLRKRKLLMKSFVISQYNYCPIIWMYCLRKSNNLIKKNTKEHLEFHMIIMNLISVLFLKKI